MARPTKWRRIENVPSVLNFSPSGDEVPEGLRNVLKIEELEAIRLKDLEGLEQGECAERMEISRPTFQRILISAREKIADSLIKGKSISIDGGNFTRNICSVKCLECGKTWMESFENLDAIKNAEYPCPACGSTKVACGQDFQGKFCQRNCWRHGRTEK